MRLFEAANILTALTFMKKIKALYRSRMKVLTDGAQYYRAACKFLSLDHDVYDLRLGNVMERMVQFMVGHMSSNRTRYINRCFI
jgi:transposase-like protein